MYLFNQLSSYHNVFSININNIIHFLIALKSNFILTHIFFHLVSYLYIDILLLRVETNLCWTFYHGDNIFKGLLATVGKYLSLRQCF